MTQGQNAYRVDMREIRFVLLEQFKTGDLLGKGHFEDWGQEELLGVLSSAERYAKEVAGPLNAVGDRKGCQLVDGAVKAPSGFAEGFAKLYENGFKSLVLEPEYGGARSPKALSLIVNELTAGPNIALDMYGGLTVGAADMIAAFATDEQKQRYCQKMFDGVWAGTMCLTETQAGSDVGAATTSATPLGDGRYHIRGSKLFISGGDQDITENIVHLVLARVDGAPKGTKGLSLFIVPKLHDDGSSNDVRVSSLEHKMGLKGSATCVVNFGDEGRCVGELCGGALGEGIRQMFHMMNFARIGVGVQGVGVASSAYLSALAHAKERKQGPAILQSRDPDAQRVPIIEHPDVKRMLLEMKSKVEGARAMIVKAGNHSDQAANEPDADLREYHQGQIELLTPLIKSYSSDQAFTVCSLAIQVCGGSGYTNDYPVEQACRDSKIFSIYEGTNHIQALDLVMRKLRLAKGQYFAAYCLDVGSFVERHTDHPRLSGCMAVLNEALKAVADAPKQFAAWGPEAIDRVALHANAFLEAMSELTVGWLLLDAATIAFEAAPGLPADHPDRAFYEGKIRAAEFFASGPLRLVAPRIRILLEAPSVALDMDPQWFASSHAAQV